MLQCLVLPFSDAAGICFTYLIQEYQKKVTYNITLHTYPIFFIVVNLSDLVVGPSHWVSGYGRGLADVPH